MHNLLDLKTAIIKYSHRSDVDFVERIPTFIDLAEARINKMCRAPEMEARTAILAPSYATDPFIALPDDYIQMRNLQLNINGGRRPLAFRTPEELDKEYSNSSGSPRAYTIFNRQIEIRPGPGVDSTYELDMMYYYKPPALVNDLDTNENLQANPSIYLYGALYEAMIYVEDDERAGRFIQAFTSDVNDLNDSADEGRFSGNQMTISGV